MKSAVLGLFVLFRTTIALADAGGDLVILPGEPASEEEEDHARPDFAES